MTQSTIRINKTLPTINEYSVAIISSNDMEPALNINDMIILKNVDEYNNDDIVAYHDRSNICIVRRFVKINSLGNIITKADINILEDAPVSKDSMYGHVVYKIKGFGIIFNTYIKYVILLINIILIIVSFIVGKKLKTTKSKTKSKL